VTPAPIYLLDTNICIHIRRERPPGVLKRFEALAPGAAAISVVTYGELTYGVCKSGSPEDAASILEQLVTLIPVLPMDSAAAKAYGAIRHDLSRRGEIIGNNDLWIAAHAISLGLTLVTSNEGEFLRVRDLKVENWASER
jgi:tRNA(fMet)-specific endonuclease VapC